MADTNVVYQQYAGSLLSTNLLSGSTRTYYMNELGGREHGTMSDASGTIYVGETFSVGGRSLLLLGSGRAAFGGSIIQIGWSYDVLLAEDPDTGERFLIYPDGAPSRLTGISMRMSLSPDAYTFAGLPVCFCAGTRILTARGEVAVEDLHQGDLAVTQLGEILPILWVGASHYPEGMAAQHRPVVLRPGALGLGLPRRPLKVSPQHRIVLGVIDGERVMGPAKALLGEAGVHQQTAARPVSYYHVLLPRHAVLLSEGVPTESLFLGRMSLQALSAEALRELCTVLDCNEAELETMPQAQPRCRFLSKSEAIAFRARMREVLAPLAV